MNICLCLYGQPRFIDNPNIKKYLDEKILSQSNDIDVYGHFWYDEDVKSFIGSEWHNHHKQSYKGEKFECVSNTIEILKEKYKFKNFLHEKPKDFSLFLKENELKKLENKPKDHGGNNYFSIHNVNSLLSHLYSIETALNLIPENKYDLIILTRYDSLIMRMVDLNKLSPDYIYASNHFGSCNFSDNILIIGSAMIKSLKAFSNITNLIDSIPLWTAEWVKHENIKYFFGIEKIKYIDILAHVARYSNDAIGQK